MLSIIRGKTEARRVKPAGELAWGGYSGRTCRRADFVIVLE
jgi:hypothetical protein